MSFHHHRTQVDEIHLPLHLFCLGVKPRLWYRARAFCSTAVPSDDFNWSDMDGLIPEGMGIWNYPGRQFGASYCCVSACLQATGPEVQVSSLTVSFQPYEAEPHPYRMICYCNTTIRLAHRSNSPKSTSMIQLA